MQLRLSELKFRCRACRPAASRPAAEWPAKQRVSDMGHVTTRRTRMSRQSQPSLRLTLATKKLSTGANGQKEDAAFSFDRAELQVPVLSARAVPGMLVRLSGTETRDPVRILPGQAAVIRTPERCARNANAPSLACGQP